MSLDPHKVVEFYYHAMGWSLLPVKPDKLPAIPWKKFQTERASEEQVHQWIKQGFGLAVATGKLSGITVIDDDRPKYDLPPFKVESPLVAKTKNGGMHHYFKYTAGDSNSANHELKVDMRGQGGYVLLPPFHGYEWIKPPTKATKLEQIPFDVSMDLAQMSKTRLSTNQGRLDLAELAGVSEGGRNDSLLQIANVIHNRHPEDEWHIAEQTIRFMNNDFNPPLPDREVDTIIKQSQTFVRANPKKTTKERVVEEATEEALKPSRIRRYSQVSATELFDIEHRPELSLGFDGIDKRFRFPSGFYVISAHPGTGKGWFATWLTRKFFERHEQKSIFYSLEMSEQDVRMRLLQQYSDFTEEQFKYQNFNPQEAVNLLKKDLIIVDTFFSDDPVKQTPEVFYALTEAYYKQGYRIFHFDHLQELSGSIAMDSNLKVSADWSKAFQELTKKYKDMWLFVFAQPNASAQKNDGYIKRVDMYGSKAITFKADVFLSINVVNSSLNKTTNSKDDEDIGKHLMLWLDKNRHGSISYADMPIYLSPTGNFYESMGDYLTFQKYKGKHDEYLAPLLNPDGVF